MLVKLIKTKFDYLEEALIFNPFRCRLQSIKCVVTFLEKIVLFICKQIYIVFFFGKFTYSVLSLLNNCSILKLLPIPMATECVSKDISTRMGINTSSLACAYLLIL